MANESALTISENETLDVTEISTDGPEPVADTKPDKTRIPIKPHNSGAPSDRELSGMLDEPNTDGTPSLNQTEHKNSEHPTNTNKDTRSPDSPGARMRSTSPANAIEMQSIRNIKVKVEAVLGGLSMPVSQLAQIKHGEIIHLDRQIGEEIEITANGQLIGRGEIVVIEDDVPKFGITLTEIY